MSEPPQLTQGQYLGNRYQILSPLGQGGMGAVHCARDRLTGQLVALKRVRLRAATSGADHTVDELASTPQHGLLTEEPRSTLMAIGGADDSSGGGRVEASATPAGSPEQIAVMQLALAREFGMLASLRHPNIIRDGTH